MNDVPVSKVHGLVKRFVKSNESYDIVPDGTWSAGGCWILAEALKRVIAQPTTLLAVKDRGRVQHIIVGLPSGKVVDADGVQTEHEMLIKMITYEGHRDPRIVPLVKSELRSGEIPFSYTKMRLAIGLLERLY